MAIEVRRLPDGFAGEVIGADLARANDHAQFRTVHATHLKYGVIVIRDQDITPAQHIAFSRRFGDLEIHVLDKFHPPDHPEILVVSNRRENGEAIGVADAGRHWHSDTSYSAEPALGSMLHALEIPPEGGDTLFADMYAVHEGLSPAMKQRIAPLRGVYDYTRDYEKARARNPDRPPLTAEQLAKVPTVTHPVVRTHPETGRKSLYVNAGHTTGIEGMAHDEAHELLEELFAFSIRDEFVYRHRWRLHDLIFWDNRCTMHHALPYDREKYTRHMHRTLIKGDKPV